jgi:hypothetical protein
MHRQVSWSKAMTPELSVKTDLRKGRLAASFSVVARM